MDNPTALGVYIFAGGFTRGILRAGFNVVGQLEDGPFGVETSRHNHPAVPVVDNYPEWFLGSIRQVDFVYSNPPCAPFSNAGVSTEKKGVFNTWWRNDPRTSCITRTFSVLENVRPHFWAWESVQGAFKRGRPLVEQLTRQALEMGYSATYVLMNAAHLGVPQVRRRFFCLFHDHVIEDWQYPPVEDRPNYVMTVRSAFRQLYASGYKPSSDDTQKHSQGLHDVLIHTPQGGSLRKTWEKLHPPETWKRKAKGHVIGRPGFNKRRLDYDKVGETVIGGPVQFHPEEDRFLSLREVATLCGYPYDYQFIGTSLNDMYAQVARAVMPPVGHWLGGVVKKSLAAGLRESGNIHLVDLEKGHTERIEQCT